jgi:hypothetical protein
MNIVDNVSIEFGYVVTRSNGGLFIYLSNGHPLYSWSCHRCINREENFVDSVSKPPSSEVNTMFI